MLSAGWLLGTGCFLDASPYPDTTGTSPVGGGDTTTTGSGGTTTSTATTSTTTTGGGGTGGTTTTGGTGGTGGTTTTGGGGTGGTGGTTTTGGTGGTGPTDPTSCTEALNAGMIASGTTTIDIDGPGPEMPFTVYCDQVNDGGGWALLYNSVGDPRGGTTTFWNIAYEERLGIKGDPPSLQTNYYAGKLYTKGAEYRDDAVDTMDNEVRGIVRATVTGFDPMTMKFATVTDAGSLSGLVLTSQLKSGWSAPNNDMDPFPTNCAVDWANVTQHYSDCWKYNLGADADGNKMDMGWGPHIVHSAMSEINAASSGDDLQQDGMPGAASRMNRISRFTRW